MEACQLDHGSIPVLIHFKSEIWIEFYIWSHISTFPHARWQWFVTRPPDLLQVGFGSWRSCWSTNFFPESMHSKKNKNWTFLWYVLVLLHLLDFPKIFSSLKRLWPFSLCTILLLFIYALFSCQIKTDNQELKFAQNYDFGKKDKSSIVYQACWTLVRNYFEAMQCIKL